MNNKLVDALLKRRSVLARDLGPPGPNEEELQLILQAAHRVPDHGKIGPWRFIIFQGESRRRFGEKLADAFLADNPDAAQKTLDFERERMMRAPVVIAVISSPIDHKVPQWEQILSCGAVCQNILHAASALSYGAQWLTEWYAYNDKLCKHLGLVEPEKIAGFIYIGSFDASPNERARPSLPDRVSYWV